MDVLSPTSAPSTRLKTYFSTRNQFPPSVSSPANPHRPSLPLLRTKPSTPRLIRCLAASPGPPQTDPPPQKDPIRVVGFSRLQESVRIFFAVLFWMSLFFWVSAFDKRNHGRPNKGSRFRR